MNVFISSGFGSWKSIAVVTERVNERISAMGVGKRVARSFLSLLPMLLAFCTLDCVTRRFGTKKRLKLWIASGIQYGDRNAIRPSFCQISFVIEFIVSVVSPKVFQVNERRLSMKREKTGLIRVEITTIDFRYPYFLKGFKGRLIFKILF